MEWSVLFDRQHRPGWEDMASYVDNPFWQPLHAFLQDTYGTEPQLCYSQCSLQKGWNVKYQKGGKPLCTLYPMPGYYIALLVIGARLEPEAELMIPLCGDYVRNLYRSTPFSAGGRWLMIEVRDGAAFEDLKRLIRMRVKPKATRRA